MGRKIYGKRDFLKRPEGTNRQGQGTLEMAVLIVVIIFAFIAMQTYMKRGIQGRLRASVDSIGEQYDPERTTSDFSTTRVSNVTTRSTSEERQFEVEGSYGGQYENRVITVSDSQTHYDNTSREGFEYVGRP
ncbi:MAG: hypothetical protein WC732_05845 [Candidatus Omnitrophota bacterium]